MRMEGQSGDEQSSREMRRDRKEAMDRDRHGERMRHREGRFRYFHEGYYYATPWWTTGIVVDGGGISCRDGARTVSRRGFNRVSPISCGGETYSYRGWRGGDPWRIQIDSDSGRIIIGSSRWLISLALSARVGRRVCDPHFFLAQFRPY